MFLEQLLSCRGVSGDEGEVRRLLIENLKGIADEVTVDALGNVIASVKGTRTDKTFMLAAHMDEVGLIVTGITDNGLIKFQNIGAVDPRVLVSKRVLVGEDKVPGVIGAKAIHMTTPAERKIALKMNQLYIDIGAPDKAAAESRVHLGDYVSFLSPYQLIGDGAYIMSRALDDRVGCALAFEALKTRRPYTLTVAFTAQEEVGCRGSKVAARRIAPVCGMALEGTTCADFGGVEPHKRSARMGAGPVVTVMDRSVLTHPELRAALVASAEKTGLPYQIKQSAFGGTDGGSIALSGTGVPTLVMAVPCFNIHSPVSLCKLSDFEAALGILDQFLNDAAELDFFKD